MARISWNGRLENPVGREPRHDRQAPNGSGSPSATAHQHRQPRDARHRTHAPMRSRRRTAVPPSQQSFARNHASQSLCEREAEPVPANKSEILKLTPASTPHEFCVGVAKSAAPPLDSRWSNPRLPAQNKALAYQLTLRLCIRQAEKLCVYFSHSGLPSIVCCYRCKRHI